MKTELIKYGNNQAILFNEDCLKVMDGLISKGVKVDSVITDLPYGTTACKWDSIILFEEMWKRLVKISKDNSAIVLFGSEPFSSQLRISNLKMYKYDWVWKKNTSSNFLQSNFQPRKIHEIISIFSNGNASYTKNKLKKMKYNPQMWGEQKVIKDSKEYSLENSLKSWQGRMSKNYKLKSQNNTGKKFPNSIIEFNADKEKIHPTQKPVELMEYLIRTYTNEGDTVLDFTMGSGTTGVACVKTKRNFIGIEFNPEKNKDGNLVEPDKYFNIAVDRIKKESEQ